MYKEEMEALMVILGNREMYATDIVKTLYPEWKGFGRQEWVRNLNKTNRSLRTMEKYGYVERTHLTKTYGKYERAWRVKA